MILRIDRLGVELPPPSTPDPAGAAAVQELMGGKFGEMSTLMNYTFQSFNFRNRQGARPFFDLIANIAAEEYGHIELVAAAINTMLTGATLEGARPRNSQQFIGGGKSAMDTAHALITHALLLDRRTAGGSRARPGSRRCWCLRRPSATPARRRRR